MISSKHNTTVLSASIISVAVSEETIEEVMKAAENISWTLLTADFESYISAARRPNISQQIKLSDICIAIVDFDRDIDQAVESTSYLQQVFGGRLTVVALSKDQILTGCW